jgi:hypothetical protein
VKKIRKCAIITVQVKKIRKFEIIALLKYFLIEDSMSVCSFGSRADLDRLSEVPMPSWIQVGESVMVTTSKLASKMTGVVQFVGNVEFASGPWVGVELDLPEGW